MFMFMFRCCCCFLVVSELCWIVGPGDSPELHALRCASLRCAVLHCTSLRRKGRRRMLFCTSCRIALHDVASEGSRQSKAMDLVLVVKVMPYESRSVALNSVTLLCCFVLRCITSVSHHAIQVCDAPRCSNGTRWLGVIRYDLTWLDITWYYLTRLGVTWRDLARLDMTRHDLTWLDVACHYRAVARGLSGLIKYRLASEYPSVHFIAHQHVAFY